MNLTKILTVSGKPGLFRMKAQNKQGIIAESLLTGKTSTIFSKEPVSILDDICMYTVDGEIKLKEVLRTIFTKYEAKSLDFSNKSGNDLRKFMLEIVPDFDQEKVRDSDIQKLIKWYNLLLEKNLVDADPDPEEDKKEAVSEKDNK